MQKYGRTYHLPISPGISSDDKVMTKPDRLTVDDLIVTEKMDGEKTTIHNGGSHARSPDSRNHPSRDWLKAFAVGVSLKLAPNERVVGENLYARHAIGYDDLPSYFLGFAWIVGADVQPWDDTLARFKQLSIIPVPTIYRGAFRPGLFESIAGSLDAEKQEGFVVRVASAFPEREMPTHLGKYVRAGHIQNKTHWMQAQLIPNRLAKS